ncbi:cytochrome oxidase maturation protein, cbb3-type [Salinihabitans flavidus]|uniref:Cytochrome oxidase maturation protein, cbb3-type n=1 Tax=Salinihabitans flavidus TaxID=569882 RepID=A0A1H8W6T7_9RHOB|nr:cytochrome oxidase maturation protein, cbb3-type [Salinihabitans flavidus]
MTSLLILIPVSLGMGLIGLAAFFWAMRTDQFDDPEGNARRVLTAEDHPPETEGKHHDPMAPHPEDRNTARGL